MGRMFTLGSFSLLLGLDKLTARRNEKAAAAIASAATNTHFYVNRTKSVPEVAPFDDDSHTQT